MLLKNAPSFNKFKISTLSFTVTALTCIVTPVNATPFSEPLMQQLTPLDFSNGYGINKNTVGEKLDANSTEGKLIHSFIDLYKKQINKSNSLGSQSSLLPQTKLPLSTAKKLLNSKDKSNVHSQLKHNSKKLLNADIQVKLDSKGTPAFFRNVKKQASSPLIK
ncbi:MAG TPA: hypothetical protein EYG71_04860 [Leucothrix sp.]|nr:hypothetical protein [Leucothrix sp.]